MKLKTSIGVRIARVKKGGQPVKRRVSEYDAVELLIECGEVYLENALAQACPAEIDTISNIVNKA